MSKFSLFSARIFTLLGVFFIPIASNLAIGARLAAQPVDTDASREIAQRITSPGLTTPIGSPTPAPSLPPRSQPNSTPTIPPVLPRSTPTPTPTTPTRSAPNPNQIPTLPPSLPKPTSTPTTPPTPTPTPTEVPIPVPPAKNPLPSGTPKPTPTQTPTTTPSPKPTPTIPQAPSNRANTPLSPEDRQKIEAYLRGRGVSQSPPVPASSDTRFILHDTSVLMSPGTLEGERRIGRGPLGLGVNAFIQRSDAAVLARPNFYESRRPTTTEFEKASDILAKPIRERYLRQVWSATDEDSKRQALDSALANLGLSSSEIAKEQKEARAKLAASSGRIFTTATWSVEWICSRYNSGDRSVVIPGREDTMRAACAPLTNYFSTRNSRVKSSVAAEIVQVGVRSERGNQNTCSASNGNIATLPNPPYSDNQYNALVTLYLRSALAAGKYPQLTTHFALDTFDPEAHCDPRCFNLTKLYSSIAAAMGHAPGSTYGVTPSYGTRLGTNNIWWNDRICHGSAP